MRLVVLDTGTLGLLTHPRSLPDGDAPPLVHAPFPAHCSLASIRKLFPGIGLRFSGAMGVLPPRDSGPRYSSQFSNRSPGTFSKSRRLAVSNRALLASEIAAIFKSRVAIRTLAA